MIVFGYFLIVFLICIFEFRIFEFRIFEFRRVSVKLHCGVTRLVA